MVIREERTRDEIDSFFKSPTQNIALCVCCVRQNKKKNKWLKWNCRWWKKKKERTIWFGLILSRIINDELNFLEDGQSVFINNYNGDLESVFNHNMGFIRIISNVWVEESGGINQVCLFVSVLFLLRIVAKLWVIQFLDWLEISSLRCLLALFEIFPSF